MFNNFNQNSKGINLELVAERSSDLASIFFDESITKINDDYFYQVEDIPEILITEVFPFINQFCIDHEIKLTNNLDAIVEIIQENYFTFSEIYNICNKYSIISNYNLLFDKLEIIGYSQGNSETIYYLKDNLFCGLKEHIQNLFYDCPLCIVLNYNDNEIISKSDCSYDYNSELVIDDFIQQIKSISPLIDHDYILDELTNIVPVEL